MRGVAFPRLKPGALTGRLKPAPGSAARENQWREDDACPGVCEDLRSARKARESAA